MPSNAPTAAPAASAAPRLVLGSTSRYRRELLGRLRLPFECADPAVDEGRLPAESPADMATRLALAKARAVAARHPDAIVIGSDQVADLDGEPLGKPGTHARALAQLHAMRGRAVLFHTAVAVVRPATGHTGQAMATVQVRFGQHSDALLDHYLRLEQPYDCAGSAKCETLGIALLGAIESDDPTALIGLPLIHTCALLRAAGLEPLAWAR
ncbi:Maf family nucleotide pyrophosphatase [Aquabacterium sp. OR-4]|nr:Maf family nucleotide pyrophosphatase [Aquabacterium sp. OR-4]MDT7834509.1 Maf family nucleotide pyrophosphatase [Aquabacterium sp. OR-4]